MGNSESVVNVSCNKATRDGGGRRSLDVPGLHPHLFHVSHRNVANGWRSWRSYRTSSDLAIDNIAAGEKPIVKGCLGEWNKINESDAAPDFLLAADLASKGAES